MRIRTKVLYPPTKSRFTVNRAIFRNFLSVAWLARIRIEDYV